MPGRQRVASAERSSSKPSKRPGESREEIDLLVLTHSHPDDIGAAKAIRGKTGCLVAAHEAEKGWIEDVDLQSRERPVPGFHALVGGSVPVGRSLADGDVIELSESHPLKVLHTPGHSTGSICLLYGTDRVLFSADTVPIRRDPDLRGHHRVRPVTGEAERTARGRSPAGGLGQAPAGPRGRRDDCRRAADPSADPLDRHRPGRRRGPRRPHGDVQEGTRGDGASDGPGHPPDRPILHVQSEGAGHGRISSRNEPAGARSMAIQQIRDNLYLIDIDQALEGSESSSAHGYAGLAG